MGDIQPLVDAFMPFAMSPGWFRSAEQDGKGAINQKMLKQFADLWQKLHKVQNNLSFNKTTMTAASKAVMEKSGGVAAHRATKT